MQNPMSKFVRDRKSSSGQIGFAPTNSNHANSTLPNELSFRGVERGFLNVHAQPPCHSFQVNVLGIGNPIVVDELHSCSTRTIDVSARLGHFTSPSPGQGRPLTSFSA